MIRTTLLLLLAWTTTAVGQVDVTLTDTVGITYKNSWDGNLLMFKAVEGCSGYAEFRIEVSEPVIVTYTASRICGGNPAVDPPFGPFSTIRNDWIVQNTPSTWSGSFTAQPGVYWYWFIGFDGRFCFDCCGGDFNADVGPRQSTSEAGILGPYVGSPDPHGNTIAGILYSGHSVLWAF